MSHNSFDWQPLEQYLASVAAQGRTMLLPALHRAQSLYGWLPPAAQETISRALRVPLADVHGVVEFYSLFYRRPMARRVVRVCMDPACALDGSGEVMAAIEQRLGLADGETSSDGEVSYERVPCLGLCEHAPCALDGERPAGHLTPATVPAFLAGELPEPAARPHGEPRWILRRVGQVDPGSLDDYRAWQGYTILPQLLAQSPDDVIAQVEDLGILGRGGAMFPLGRKWRFARAAPGDPSQKHVIVNADESEPGTFKDRVLLEEDPFAVIEALTIAGYAVGASHGWIFIRGEYPRAWRRLEAALAQARLAGLLGPAILGREGFDFDITLRLGAGAYICGEETALFEAIEGQRGFPRIKPPFPTTHGLFGQPTAINNVETLVAMLAALEVGPDRWLAAGTAESPGTKLFCLSGHVARPGVYEVPFGPTIAGLIDQAGGVPSGRAIQAVLVGGAAGIFVGPDELDMPLTYGAARERGVPLGSGVIMVFDETANLGQALVELSRFFAHESCGKCFPCQLGTQRQLEILERIVNGGPARPGDRVALEDIGFAMTETSLCGLGQTAASAVLSALARWPELVPA